MKIKYKLRKSRRARRPSLAVYCDSSVVVTLPQALDERVAHRLVEEKIRWLLEKIDYFRKSKVKTIGCGGAKEYQKNKKRALDFALARLGHFNRHYNLTFNKVVIKRQKTRWGSCSKKGNLNYNYKILFLPPASADYIIVHELCHLREFNHSNRFWALVRQTISDCRAIDRQMKKISL